jgi:sugar lactone lactonase YvrE
VSAAPPYAASVFARGDGARVVLHAPKGMAIHGDTLWVADIDALRGFERHTGAPLATIDFAAQRPVMLNDVAVAPDGTLRVTDTGIVMSPKGIVHTGPDRIFAVGPGAAVSVAAEGLALRQPNGVTWDAAGKRWVVVSFDTFVGEVAAMPATGGERRVLHRSKLGRFDGVEALRDGTILYTSWVDSSVHALTGARDRRIVREVQEAADIGLDTRRGILAIPLATLGRVQLWKLGPDVTGSGAR